MFILNTKRVQSITVYEYEGAKYVKTREVAGVLGIKQPFEFTAQIKRVLGNVILKEKATEEFRSKEDKATTPFIELNDLLNFLKKGEISAKLIYENYKNLIEELELLLWKN